MMHIISMTQSKYNKYILSNSNFTSRFQGIKITEKRAYMDLPTVGYQGFKSLYRMPTTKVDHRKDPFFNINPLRPKLNTRDITENGDY